MKAVVSSCSLEGWHEYGKTFHESFERHWPSDVRLIMVSEDTLPVDHVSLQDSPGAVEFMRRHNNQRSKGFVRLPGDHGWTPKKVADGYNFRYDAFRFAKKVFSIGLAASMVDDNVDALFWCDADTKTFAPVPITLLDELLPKESALCCLQRGTYHSECGFVGYNLRHEDAIKFIFEFVDLYDSDAVFNLQEWHDSWVFDWLRRELRTPTKPIENCSRHHPFVNSVLGRYMDHLKGDRKTTGTLARELIINRDVPYWQARL